MNTKLLETVSVALKEMLESNSERILEELEKSGTHKLKVTLSVALDASSAAPHAQLKIRYAPEAVTDLRSILGEDPNQLGMPFGVVDPSGENRMSDQPAPVKRGRGRPKGSGKKKKPVAEPEQPPVEPAPDTQPETE
jgi:hypothetical protein